MGLRSRAKRQSSKGASTGSVAAGSDPLPSASRNAGQRNLASESDHRSDSIAKWVLDDSAALGITQELDGPAERSDSFRTRSKGARDSSQASLRPLDVPRRSALGERSESFTLFDDEITVPLGYADSAYDAPRVMLPPAQVEPGAAGRAGGDGLEITESIEAPSLALNLGNSQSLPRQASHASLSKHTERLSLCDDSIAFEVPTLALPTQSSGLPHAHSQQSPSKQTDVSDTIDAPSISISLHLPAKAANSASLSLQTSAALAAAASNSRATPHLDATSTSDVLEAPSLSLPQLDVPVQTCSIDAERHSLFTFPAAQEPVPGTPVTPQTARADDTHLAALAGEWMPLSPTVTPLHAAAFDGDAQALQALLADAKSIDELWTSRGTPLHFAVQGDRPECVRMLLDAGMDIDAENGDGLTPLMQAAVMGHELALLTLIDRGASISKAFLPGSSEGLLHFCVEHDMVQGLQAVLLKPEGKRLARASRMKPIYSALTSLAEICTSHQGQSSMDGGNTPLSPGAIAASATEPNITRAKSVVDMLLQHSDLPENASYDDLITHAQESYKVMETTGGSSCDTLDCLFSPENVSSMSPCAFTANGDPESGRASSRTSGGRRFVFTPTANLDCSPANCSPLSVFGSERAESCTPSALSRSNNVLSAQSLGSVPALQSEGSSPILASAVGLSLNATVAGDSSARESHSSGRDSSARDSTPRVTVVTPRTPSGDPGAVPAVLRQKQLRVRTRIPE